MNGGETLRGPAVEIVSALGERRVTVATVESCTGGMIAACITDVPGSSAVFDRGFVTYSNAAKTELVGVPPVLIERHGAVSEEVARAMAEGGRQAARTSVAIAVTGIAGPGGGSADKPVGLVHLAVAHAGGTHHRVHRFGAIGRDAIRRRTVMAAFDLLAEALQIAGDGRPRP